MIDENADLRRVTVNVSHGRPPSFRDVPTREVFQGVDVWNVQVQDGMDWKNATVPLARIDNPKIEVTLLAVTGDIWFMEKDRETALTSLRNAVVFALEAVKDSAEKSIAAMDLLAVGAAPEEPAFRK